jgi:hypothetical protein
MGRNLRDAESRNKEYTNFVDKNKTIEIMQTTLIIELNNPTTRSILKKMERLDLLRIVKKQSKVKNISDSHANSITEEQALLMNRELK